MKKNSNTELFAYSVLCHQNGNIAEAKRGYKEILKNQPLHSDALHLLGVISAQEGKIDNALSLLGKALKIKGDHPFYLSDYANILMKKGNLIEAVVFYQKAIELMPEYAEAYNNKGLALTELERPEDAIHCYNKAITLNPKFYQAYSNRGAALRKLGKLDESIADYDFAISIAQDYFNAHFNKGNALKDKMDYNSALQSYKVAIKIQPNNADVYFNCAKVYRDINNFENSIEMYEMAISKNPSYLEAYINIGQLFADLGKHEESICYYNKAIALKKTSAEAYYNRGNSFRSLKNLNQAIDSYDKAIKYKKDYADAYYNKALSLLLSGNLKDGFRYYEYRNSLDDLNKNEFSTLPWLGDQEIIGKTLFVYHEQGLGDTIQFCRYLFLLKSSGANILFAPQMALSKLMASLDVPMKLVNIKDESLIFDYHCPLMSLPYVFNTTLENIPNNTPYLAAASSNIDKWSKIIGTKGFKIGVCWQASNTEYGKDRSFSLSYLKQLSIIPHVRIISLQKEETSLDDDKVASEINLEKLGNDLDAGPDAFIDTSAIMKCCDLIITADTAIAHLAGALGVPVWVALNYLPDWRYMLERNDSPWYPTMKLFRQRQAGNWTQVFSEVEKELCKIV